MPQDISNIPGGLQVKDLNDLFLKRLRRMSEQFYRPFVTDGIVRPEEAENELMRYYATKKSGLQTVYSYYAEQWDFFHRASAAGNALFLSMLRQACSLFESLYTPLELNPAYYIAELSVLPRSDCRWLVLRRHFMQKWERLLSRREYVYQLEHIDRLCEDYYRMVKSKADMLHNKGRMGGSVSSRLAWLQLTQSPEMRDAIGRLVPVMHKSPVIRELNRILGRKKADEERLYQAVSGEIPLRLLRRATHSDITGVTVGNNLNALLPVEYCYLSDERLEDIFIRRYTENKLAVFDAVSRQHFSAEASSRRGNDVNRNRTKGPFVVCVDTSGSMKGERELYAKAVVLALALLSERQGRLCRVILFSDQVEVIELRNLYDDLVLLENFLCRSFHGGSDITCAMEESVRTLVREDFRYADLLWLSDFEMEPVSPVTAAYVEELKQRNLRVYAVGFGNHCERSYISLANRFFSFQDV